MNTNTTTPNELTLTDVSAPSSGECSCGGCGCGDDASANADSRTEATATASPVFREDFLVAGMTCGHCVASVTEELTAVAGVASVAVALDAGSFAATAYRATSAWASICR